jgi:putative ABC transport system permease protein
MDLDALHRLMREDGVITGARLLVDAERTADIYRRLRARPAIASVSSKQAAIDNLRRMIEENLMVSVTVNILFAMIISFGIVYNNARISLSERGRELASLRVLGLTRGEISYILLGELAVLVLAALPPLGFIAGRAATAAILVALNSEVMRFPLVVNGSTYALAALVVIVAAVISGLLVRRRLDRLDLVEVLKTRE